VRRRLRTSLVGLFLAALGLSCAAAALSACGGAGGATPSVSPSSDSVVVTVNGRPVRRSAVDSVRAEFRLGGSSGTEARAVKESIRREIVRQEAERLGVVADPADVLRRRQAMVDQLGGEAALLAALKRVPITGAQLRRDLEDGVLREALQNEKFPRLAATSAGARAYYELHRDTLFRRPASLHLGSIQVAAERIAESALARIRSGRPFAEVARQFTTDAEAKAKSGDMGWVLLSSLPAPLRKAIAHTKPGGVSKPVAGPGGWFVLKVLAQRPARLTPFAAVERRLVKELTGRKRFQALDAWLDSARRRAAVSQP
jgi:parvulin-like peptidyl-prolyl isomerase